MAKCWELRGCDEEMQSNCPHATQIMDRCPSKCAFATCDRPTHALTSDPALVFSIEVDRGAAIKDVCTYCEFFIIHGPRL